MIKLKKYSFFYCFLLLILNSLCSYGQKNTPALYLIISEAAATKKDTLIFNSYKEITTHLSKETEVKQRKGFIASYFSAPKKINDSVFTSTLTINKKTSVIVFNNIDTLPSKIQKKITSYKSKNAFAVQNIETLANTINQEYSKGGDLFSSVQFKNIKQKKDTLFADIIITNSKKRTLDSLSVNGYKKFPMSFLKYYSNIRKGAIFNRKKIQSQTELLNSLPFTQNKRPAEVLFNPKQTVLYLYLEKKTANNFDGFLGFSTNEENGNLVLDGYVNLNLINNLNYGEEIALTYKSDSEEQQLFKINTKLPYIFKLPLSLEAGLEIFRQKEEFSSTEQKIGITYAFSQKLETLIGYKKIESADLNENENLVSINQNFDATFLNLKTRFNIRQTSRLFPLKTEIIVSTEAGNRKQGDVNQLKLGAQLQQIFQLNKRNSIYIANNTQAFLSNNYLANELYRLGGILSIRGFEENSLRASFFNVLNTEYRFQLNQTIYVHSIIDFAFIDNQSFRTTATTERVGSENLSSFGVGFGMITKAGLFKLNYANGRSSSIPFEFSNSKVHISLTAFF